MNRHLIDQVRELLERHLDVMTISRRLHVDVDTVNTIVEIIKNVAQ
jgi:hypothetical protein